MAEARLNVMCAICDEFYKPEDNIAVSKKCGHAHHRSCLMRWLRNKASCPQCRTHCCPSDLLRLYFNYGEPVENSDLLPNEKTTYYWQYMSLDDDDDFDNQESIPKGAVKVGTDPDGCDTYVARVCFADDLLPANYVPTKHGVYTPWNCEGHFLTQDVEILILVDQEIDWVPSENGDVPPNAFKTGENNMGETLYTGRAVYEGITLLGKVHPTHGVLYMPYKGEEVNVKQYEVLVQVPKA